ncbi:MAG TPA: 3,4-dehydroadipyl-CoA semialdehyde dehydrogenase [Candidatus Acidoferrum sp.]|jgi:3,4-dehydroadipyl-CoA semialdehyde dehydrogenase|nr:3,4-dehydroadipyl-CoA semialdehyde dehydrogenase [Candidatus Acidoferrum sp.]
MKLPNYLSGQWLEGAGPGEPLFDPVTGDELARISSQNVDLRAALEFARTHAGPALRQLNYYQRADLLAKVADTLSVNRDEYFRLSLLNLGATPADASFDVDGAIYTMKYYAKIGRALAAGKLLKEGSVVPLSKTGAFIGQHFLLPAKGAAVFINAFNFPAWGLCEKAAPALLSGVPVMVKPASPTAWLTQRMVEDIVKANILPPGAVSLVCGSARELLDHVCEEDIVSFTGSADTAARIRSHANILRRSVRVNIEADSINSAILGPDSAPGTDLFDVLVKEVVKEMTLKAGQKCTTIRRVLVPRQHVKAFGEAVSTILNSMKVGNPRNSEVKVGPVVNKAQQSACLEGLKKLKEECTVLFGGHDQFQPVDADPQKSAFVQPTLLACKNGLEAKYVHDVEVFGPVATLVPYDGLQDLLATTRRGLGSLVASVFSNDQGFLQEVFLGIGDLHGRILAVDSSVAGQYTGHGNVVPSCLHGGPGRAGGGEELAGLRALLLYHRRFVVQGPVSAVSGLSSLCADSALLYA